jgi:hypothetical protein
MATGDASMILASLALIWFGLASIEVLSLCWAARGPMLESAADQAGAGA